jgi:hypothetical protein
MSQSFHFDGYMVRPVMESDRSYLSILIRADKYHCDRMDADYFMKPLPGETSWALEGPQGRVLFYFKTTPVVRMSIQFTGNETPQERESNRDALIKGLAWIEAMFAAARFREFLFDTEGPELTIFARKRLGFTNAPGLMVRMIPTFDTANIQPEDLGTVPTSTSGSEG